MNTFCLAHNYPKIFKEEQYVTYNSDEDEHTFSFQIFIFHNCCINLLFLVVLMHFQ